MATSYKVLSPMIQLHVTPEGGTEQVQQFYAGAVVPEGANEEDVQRHLDDGLIVKESDKLAEVFAVPAGSPLPGQPPNVPVTETGSTAQPIPPLSERHLKAAGIKSSESGKAADDKPASKPAAK